MAGQGKYETEGKAFILERLGRVQPSIVFTDSPSISRVGSSTTRMPARGAQPLDHQAGRLQRDFLHCCMIMVSGA
jgi:hypothetical protein